MEIEIISQRGNLLIRRLILEPGEAMWWHADRCTRFSVVVQGNGLAIEYQDTGEKVDVPVYPGLADWDEPQPRIHRGVNSGTTPYEEVVLFFLNSRNEDPQPEY